MFLRTNPLHPTAVYPEGTDIDLDGFVVPEGFQRARLICDAGRAPDGLIEAGWQQVKRTAYFRIATQAISGVEAKVTAAVGPNLTDWYKLHWQYYEACHSDNPPQRPASLARTFGQSIEDGSAVFIDTEHGMGFASLRGMRAGVSEAGWLGGPALAVQLGIVWCCHFGHSIGAREIEFEADDTDPPLWSALQKKARPIQEFETWELLA